MAIKKILFLLLLFPFVLKAQNRVTELSSDKNNIWFNSKFGIYTDSITYYQQIIKEPQIPSVRKQNIERYNIVLHLFRTAMRSFLLAHRTDSIGAKALLMSCFRNLEVNMDTLSNMKELLIGNGVDNGFYSYLSAEIKGRENFQTGKSLINFAIPDLNNRLIKPTDYRGKYILINFWASWCAPCRAEIPDLLVVYNEFREKNLQIIAVSVDTQRSSWLNAVKSDHTNWINVFDGKAWDGDLVRSYAIHQIPQNLLVDPSGQIVAKNISAEGLKKILSK